MEMTREKYLTKFEQRGPDECWPWQELSRDKNGYGILSWRVGRKVFTRRAHRWGWEDLHGPIPPGMVIRHTCDNPPCQNPAHWLLGSVAQNNEDARQRGRARGNPGGEAHHLAVLSDALVAEARSRYTGAYGEQTALAREYGVSRRSMARILQGIRR